MALEVLGADGSCTFQGGSWGSKLDVIPTRPTLLLVWQRPFHTVPNSHQWLPFLPPLPSLTLLVTDMTWQGRARVSGVGEDREPHKHEGPMCS